jgi:hypothetical protein
MDLRTAAPYWLLKSGLAFEYPYQRLNILLQNVQQKIEYNFKKT